MRIRQHNGFGHGLRPGETQDINCPSCQQERAQGIEPTITGEDNPLPEYWTQPTPENVGEATDEAQFRITLQPPTGETELDDTEVNAFTHWLSDVLDGYVGGVQIETDFL